MNIQVNEFMWKPGENDAEYIKLLKRSNEEAHSLMLKATGKLAKMAKTKANEWISVEDRLPDKPGEYLVAYHPCHWVQNADYSITQVGIDNFRGKTSWARQKYQFVTHWMPLPEPPKGE